MANVTASVLVVGNVPAATGVPGAAGVPGVNLTPACPPCSPDSFSTTEPVTATDALARYQVVSAVRVAAGFFKSTLMTHAAFDCGASALPTLSVACSANGIKELVSGATPRSASGTEKL